MAYLIDTSVLARLANVDDLSYPAAFHAVTELHRRGEVLHIAPQNLVEFRSVATRPAAVNGLGLTSGSSGGRAPHGVDAPKGPQQISPGQRPGKRDLKQPHAL
jgi:hypothetical protein